MKCDVPHDDEAVTTYIGVIIVIGLTVMVAAVVGAQAVGLGSNQPTFAHGGVVTDLNSNGDIEVTYLADGGQADYIEVTFSGNSTTGTARLNTPGAKATLSEGVIDTTGDAELVRKSNGLLGEDVLIRAIAFKSKDGVSSSTLIYQTSSESEFACIEDDNAGHGNNCGKTDPDNPGN